MRTKIDWNAFKAIASADLSADGAYIYRGQRDALWTLKTSIHRTSIVQSPSDIAAFPNVVLPIVHEAIESWTGRKWNLSDPLELAQFGAFLQHNGFPTPLLDWTYSPYVAAYFAFESVNHFQPQSESVAIYSFKAETWCKLFTQIYDYADQSPHVSVLRPRMIGNHKLAIQQGCFTWTNVSDIEAHIRGHEAQTNQQFLIKYELDVRERPRVIKELALMGISAIQLMPSVESVCKKALEDIIGLQPIESPKPR
ncbi:MAG: FRG domain-containing protein [Xanthomonadales bacterium]|nr:FRG domain-containing protein [Xanthomonadales bacterium]